MKYIHRLCLPALLAAMALPGCKKVNNGPPPGLNCEINGMAWNSFTYSALIDTPGTGTIPQLDIKAYTDTGANQNAMGFYIPDYNGKTGTYSISRTGQARAWFSNGHGTYYSATAGTLTLTGASPTAAQGSYSFTTDSAGLTITSGTFNVYLQ